MTLDHTDRGRSEHLWILGLAVLALAGSFLLQCSPEGNIQLPVPCACERLTLPETCPSRVMFGVSCPGCGLTRSFVAMARGNIGAAGRFSPMGPALFVLCWLQIPYRLCEYFRVGHTNGMWVMITDRLHLITWAAAVGLLAAWAVRLLVSHAALVGFW
jgi:hypothetical protein